MKETPPRIADHVFIKYAIITAYYPEGNKTWTDSKKQNYGAQKVTWVTYDAPDAEPEETVPPTTEPELAHVLGDSNHDGSINAKDATMVLRCSVGDLPAHLEFCEICADFTGEGVINAKDATMILRYSVGMSG